MKMIKNMETANLLINNVCVMTEERDKLLEELKEYTEENDETKFIMETILKYNDLILSYEKIIKEIYTRNELNYNGIKKIQNGIYVAKESD